MTISVSDTGCGIPPDKLGAIFEDFATTKRQGLGLGLAVCKKIVEQLSGTIRVSSEVGKGSTFSVTFPELAEISSDSTTAASGAHQAGPGLDPIPWTHSERRYDVHDGQNNEAPASAPAVD